MTIEEVKSKKNKGAEIKNSVSLPIEKEKSPLDIFLEELGELNEKEKESFDKIKDIRLNTCLLEEYEAFPLDAVQDYANLITHHRYEKIRFDEEGVIIELRTPLLNSKNEVIAKELTVLFETNKDREISFTKKMRVKANDLQSQSDYSDALIAASIKSVEINGTVLIISPNSFRKINSKDKEIIVSCYNFFRK